MKKLLFSILMVLFGMGISMAQNFTYTKKRKHQQSGNQGHPDEA